MNNMERLILKQLSAWKDSLNRKPLIIRGARQVGKSYIIQKFGKTCFNGRVHTIDLERHPEWHSLFDQNLDPVRLLNTLEILVNARITPGEDLLFLDEIQSCPRAIMSLRYFYEEMPTLHVIAAGSLIEFALKDISFPVGRVHVMQLNPMNFREYLMALGKDKLADIIMNPPERLTEVLHNLLMEHLRQYMFVGGMPECVKIWRESQRIQEVMVIQSDLLATFRQDFSKYKPYVDPKCINQTLDYLSRHIGHQIKYAKISNDFTGPTNKKAFDSLQTARMVHKIRATSPASLPFAGYASEKKFKSIMLDMGIMHALNGLQSNLEYARGDLLSMYDGKLAEQFTGQELLVSGMEELYYWAREAKSSNAEIDYLIVRNGGICPVEVKSGASGSLRSMHLLLEEHPEIEMGYVLSSAPYGIMPEKRISFLPLYYACGLSDTKV